MLNSSMQWFQSLPDHMKPSGLFTEESGGDVRAERLMGRGNTQL